MKRIYELAVLVVCCTSMLSVANCDERQTVAATSEPPKPLGPAEVEFFEKQIRPLLVRHCFECHSAEADDVGGGLRLDSRDALLRGGDTGPAVRPFKPTESLLVDAVRYRDPLLQMPPDGKLSQREIDALIRWVELGAPDPRDGIASPAAALPSTDADEKPQRQWWSFQPLQDGTLPQVHDREWPLAPIDLFVLNKLESAGMSPPANVDRRKLIRRVSLDLIGLPPTPAEVDAFIRDDSPQALAQLVDRLLASQHYGERWGRHWLDVVRYADTSGCNGDFPVPEAFRYRNYVIDSWNADKPYDRFITEQIAGDLLPAASQEQRHEQLVATGYLAISRRFSSLAEEFHLTLDDSVDNLGKALLGLTISCARCHDHKFDPIPQTDYYALYGIFQSTRYAFPGTEIYRHTRHHVPLVSAARQESLLPVLSEMDALDEEIFAVYTEMASRDTGAEKNRLREKWNGLKEHRDKFIQELPVFDKAYAVSESEPEDVRLQIKGDPQNLGDVVPRGFLQILGGQRVPEGETGSGRGRLAQWLVSPTNPLTARVLVNRVWQHHFGKGLVRTPDDFGTRGARPTHPGLLDYLARRFIESGWSIKALHRAILLSRTYQMAVAENRHYALVDPDNEHLWTFRRRRLDAEALRDSMLAVSGALDRSKGGAHPFKPEWKWRYSQHIPFIGDFPTRRRTVYLMQQRIRQQAYLGVFDGADTNAATGVRQVSTTPQQALFMLNGEFIHRTAKLLAERLVRERETSPQRIQRAYALSIGRPPSQTELAESNDHLRVMQELLEKRGGEPSEIAEQALASLMRVMLSSNEFTFVE